MAAQPSQAKGLRDPAGKSLSVSQLARNPISLFTLRYTYYMRGR
eukprot:COSAG01_NODE_7364_length_3236_cov_3.667517_4_plen_43_part_01